jgi:hypothetical protein
MVTSVKIRVRTNKTDIINENRILCIV